jgi:urea carboxylase-associated protein 2
VQTLDSLTPDEYRARYDALLAAARARATASPAIPPPAPLDPAAIRAHETIPPYWYTTLRLRRGEGLRLANPGGTPGVTAFFWSADDPMERYSAADSVKVQWTTRLTAGLLLLSDMGRAMLSIIADSGGAHDALLGGGLRGPRSPDGARDPRDNALLAAAKLGLEARDVSPGIGFFAGVRVTGDRFVWDAAGSRPGGIVDLRAEMPVLVALSNWPHPLAPADARPAPVEATVFAAAPVGDADACRTAGPEAARAFDNTDALFAGGTTR